MSDTNAFDFSADFPEYAAECDEHLTAAARVLLAADPDPSRIDREQLDGLFRNFHSIKGLSGMVGVREAEQLAHHTETYLGALRKERAAWTSESVEILLEVVRALEEIIAARRDQRPPPDMSLLLSRLTQLLPAQPESAGDPASSSHEDAPEPTSAAMSPDKQRRLAEAIQRGHRAWQIRFTPSADFAARGVSVNVVRERLKSVGDIIHAEPAALPGGGVTFTFVIVTEDTDISAVLRMDEGDGLSIAPYKPAPSTAASGEAGIAALTPTSLVRVDLGRLDELMRVVGELVITRARLDNGLGRLARSLPSADRRDLQETSQAMERQLRELRDGVMRTRLVPVRDVFARMRLVVREMSRDTGKDVDLVLTGEQTEVDKFVVERLADPLLHLVRNAVSHGLESSEQRLAAGKPARGRIDLRARAAGGAIVIEVEDDGRGIDPEQVFAAARAVGLVAPDAPTDPAAMLDLICAPGFSTREIADRASGRGVGMDVVRRAVEELGGTLRLDSRTGHGTRFTARLPLTLAIADALIVAVQDQIYAVPQSAVREVVPVEPAATTTLENNELIRRPGGVLPLVRLSDLFGAARSAGTHLALVTGDGETGVALGVDRVLGLREIVVRPLADPLVQVPGLAGATELGDGRAVLILDAVGLVRYARTRRRSA